MATRVRCSSDNAAGPRTVLWLRRSARLPRSCAVSSRCASPRRVVSLVSRLASPLDGMVARSCDWPVGRPLAGGAAILADALALKPRLAGRTFARLPGRGLFGLRARSLPFRLLCLHTGPLLHIVANTRRLPSARRPTARPGGPGLAGRRLLPDRPATLPLRRMSKEAFARVPLLLFSWASSSKGLTTGRKARFLVRIMTLA